MRRNYSREEKHKAMIMYVTTDMTIKEVGEALDIPLDTIYRWSSTRNWLVLKKDPKAKLDGMLSLTTDRLDEYGKYLEDLMVLWSEAETIADKERVLNMHMKLDQNINKWLLITDNNV